MPFGLLLRDAHKFCGRAQQKMPDVDDNGCFPFVILKTVGRYIRPARDVTQNIPSVRRAYGGNGDSTC